MKKLLLTLATVLASVAMNAQEVSFYGIIPETSDLKNVAVEFYMNNSTAITYMQSKFKLPEGANFVKQSVWNEDDEEYNDFYAIANAARMKSDHSFGINQPNKATGDLNVILKSESNKTFKLSEGMLFNFLIDASALADGDYVVTAYENLAGFTTAGENPVEYYLPDFQIPFSIVDGKVENTAVGINSVAVAAKKDGKVFDMMGREVKAASKGLYIINGKKVYIK